MTPDRHSDAFDPADDRPSRDELRELEEWHRAAVERDRAAAYAAHEAGEAS